jgi:hypothetical protein
MCVQFANEQFDKVVYMKKLREMYFARTKVENCFTTIKKSHVFYIPKARGNESNFYFKPPIDRFRNKTLACQLFNIVFVTSITYTLYHICFEKMFPFKQDKSKSVLFIP